MTKRVLVAGVGNIFLGDDGFGVAVAQRLASRSLPDGIEVRDFGLRGIHLAYELLDGYETLILVDAMDLGEAPGTVAFVEPDDVPVPDPEDPAPMLEAHSMQPAVVLGMMATLGVQVHTVVILGCQPASLEEGMGLTPVVAEAVDMTVELLDDLFAEIYQPAETEVAT